MTSGNTLNSKFDTFKVEKSYMKYDVAIHLQLSILQMRNGSILHRVKHFYFQNQSCGTTIFQISLNDLTGLVQLVKSQTMRMLQKINSLLICQTEKYKIF